MALGVDPSADQSQQVFDELLTVSSEPDARELFQHLIAAIGRIVPYSAATNFESFEPQVGRTEAFRFVTGSFTL